VTKNENTDDAIREEFLAEANEIVESLSRDLLVLDQGQNERSHELINEVFRGVHTLKGMAGMFGYQQVSAVAHELENLLDDLRVGRIDLTREVLDVLFAGVESFQKLLATEFSGDDDEAAQLSRTIEKLASESRQPRDPLKVYELSESVLSVLTEYEEHRLRTNVLEDVPLYRYRVSYPLQSIDVSLEELKKRAKPLGEIITYLPSIGAAGSDAIDLEILLASRAKFAELVAAIASDGGKLEAVPRARAVLETQPPLGERAPQGQTLAGDEFARAEQAGMATSAGDAAAELATLRSVGHSVRVDIRKLDHLMNVVSELSLARAVVERVTDRLKKRPELRAMVNDLHRANRSLRAKPR
jgi:two-component system chemotaxis sensor kinase CheA